MPTEILRPNAAGDETNVQYVVETDSIHWKAVNEATPDEWTTMVWQQSSTPGRDLYNLPAHSIGSGTINSVKIYFRCSGGYSEIYPSFAMPALKVDGVIYNGTNIDVDNYPNFTTFNQTWTTKPGGGAWGSDWSVIDDMQIGITLTGYNTETSRTYCTQVYVEVDYTSGYDISVSDGIKAGDTPTTIGSFQHTLTDGIKLGDSPSAGFIFPLSLTDGLKLGDSPATTLTHAYYVALTDGVKLGDLPSAFRTLSLILADGLKAGDTLVINIQGHGFLIRVITSKYRDVEAVTSKYRDVKAITTGGGKV